jgi:putative nucleotidyltransferase with HDIG domain
MTNMAVQRAEHYVERVKQLPPAPTVLIELLDLFKQPDRGVDRIVELIAYDPALTAEVLKLCNSAAFASDYPVEDMFEAVARIGFYEVYRLVAGISGSNMLAVTGQQSSVASNELWTHSVTVALAAETLAQRNQVAEGTPFTAGLLHDIGKVVLASVEPESYAQVLSRARDQNVDLVLAERDQYGLDHAEIGGCLLARWKLPERLVAAVKFHHIPPGVIGQDRLAPQIFLANQLTQKDSQALSATTTASLDRKLEKANGLLAVHG